MTAVAMSTAASNSDICVVNESNLSKIESFLNDTAYREAIENSSNYNSRLCRDRRLRMPFLDSQTGVAQNHSALFNSHRERLPGLLHGQIYTYPSKRWRKKRRQYLMHYTHPKRFGRSENEDHHVEGVEGIMPGINDDSKDSLGVKDEHSKDGWYYDEQDMLDMDAFDEQDPDSDFDYEESYSSKRRKKKGRGGHHPARNHLPNADSPSVKRPKGGRGRKKANYDAATDAEKPFVCDLCSARYKTRPGLVYHYGHSHSTSSGDPAMELSPSPAEVENRSIADAAALDQSGGTRRGRQQSNVSAVASMAPSPGGALGPVTPGGCGGGPMAQSGPPQIGSCPPTSPSVPKEEGTLGSAGSPGPTPPNCPSPVKMEGGSLGMAGNQASVAPPNPGSVGGGGGGSPMMPMDQSNAESPLGLGPGGIEQAGGGPGYHPGPNNMERKGKNNAAPSPYCDFCLGDARENKKTGGSEDLVSCSDCGRSGKPEEKTKRKYTRRGNHN